MHAMVRRLIALVPALAACDTVFGLRQDTDARVTDLACEVGTPFPAGVPAMITGAYSVEAARFTQDEQIAYLSLCERGGSGSTCDLYRGQRFDTGMIGGYSAIASSDSSKYDAYPTVTSDGAYLVFSSKRDSDTHNYIVPATQGQFTAAGVRPLPVAADLASSNEPYLLGDGKTLYFSGNYDLLRAQGDAPEFGGVANRTALASLNTSSWDVAPVATNDELELFFSSDRDGGGLDLFTASRSSIADELGPATKMSISIPDLGPSRAEQQLEWPVWISRDRCTLYYIAKAGLTDTAIATLYVTSRRSR